MRKKNGKVFLVILAGLALLLAGLVVAPNPGAAAEENIRIVKLTVPDCG
jgi:hypothetical protein